MTDRPYTDADLRAEAVAQHQGLTDDPEYFTVGEAMCDAKVPSSATGETWETLLDEAGYSAAQEKIHDLITGAANTSTWAVELGADGLQPGGYIDLDAPGGRARLLIAWDPTTPAEARDELMADLINAIGPVVPIR